MPSRHKLGGRMMAERQQQKAGDNSQLIQAGTVIVGIDEKRAREIVDEKLHEVIENYSQEAHVIAETRINLFANDLIPKLIKDSLLDELKDPSVQILLLEAQKTAAASERSADYSLLSELLIHRVKKGTDRNARAGVGRAVEIVDEISDEALLGLTAAHSVSHFLPIAGRITDGIRILDDLFSKLLYDILPDGNVWLDHLDILDAIRISPIGSMKKINQYYPEQFPGYVDVGFSKDSESFDRANTLILQAGLPADILFKHELRDGYVRLPLLSKSRIDLISITRTQVLNFNGQLIPIPLQQRLTNDQKSAVLEIYGLYDNNAQLRKENISKFMGLWDSYDSLKKLREWWDKLPQSFKITGVGRVLAHANAQRCDPTIPALD